MTRARDPGWELYRSFLAVMREGSLTGAARALGLAQPTLGRHVSELEQRLGAVLFTRSAQGLMPTATAEAMMPQAAEMAAAAETLRRTASGAGSGTQGIVRITVSDVLGAEVVPGMLADLRAAHPGLVFELVLSNRNEDLLRREADLAVRMVRPVQEALVAKSIGRIPLGFYARRDYLARHGTPRRLADLARHAMIGFDRELISLHSLKGLPIPFAREDFAFRSDSNLAQLAAVRAGLGIGAVQVPIAARQADLDRVLPKLFAPWLEGWIVMHEDLRKSRPLRLVFDHLAAALTAYARERPDPHAADGG